MKKVLLIGMTSGIGGVETFITNLLRNIDQSKFDVDVLLFQDVNSRYLKPLAHAKHIQRVNAINIHPWHYLRDVVSFYRRNKYDIVHVSECTAKLFVYCWPVIFNRHSKLIVHSHNGNGETSIANSVLAPIQRVMADQLWSCSNEASRWMFGTNFYKYNVHTIKNGIDVQRYTFSNDRRVEIRNKLGIKDDIVVIGSVGRFEKQKNHEFLIDVFKQYHQINPKSQLVLVGDGSLRKHIEKKVIDNGLTQNVNFLGNRSDVDYLLQGFDILLLPSLYEGLPYVALEAQAAGLPILAADTIDSETNILGTVKFLSLKMSHTTWAVKITEIISKNYNRADTKHVNEEFVQHGYDLKETIRKIQQLYLE